MAIRNRDVLQCLPLLGSALGNQYGVTVTIGGQNAYCYDKTINLPALPPDGDASVLPLVRGFIDHEAAHIRFTNEKCWQRAGLNAVTKHIWNSLEDWRVEQKMSAIYPGCREHFRWLIANYGFKDVEIEAGGTTPAFLVMRYVLAAVRHWDVSEIGHVYSGLRLQMEARYPGLAPDIDAILMRVRAHCPDTQAALDYANEIVACIRNWQSPAKPQQPTKLKQEDNDRSTQQSTTPQAGTCQTSQEEALEQKESSPDSASQAHENHKEEQGDGPTDTSSNAEQLESPEAGNNQCDCDHETQAQQQSSQIGDQDPAQELQDLCALSENALPKELGKQLEEELKAAASKGATDSVNVARIGYKDVQALGEIELQSALQSSIALRQRLQGLLQARAMKRCAVGRRGRLDTSILHRMSVGNPKVFRRDTVQKAFSTAVHILIDSSGSMQGEIELARQAAYACAKSLEQIKGVNLGVTGFPCKSPHDGVYPLVTHGQRVGRNFNIEASGTTPLAQAMWWTLQQLMPLREERKIILVLTDGSPDNTESALQAIRHAKQLGIEVYGIGIGYSHVSKFFPDYNCMINKIEDLAPAMFTMLQRALLGGKTYICGHSH